MVVMFPNSNTLQSRSIHDNNNQKYFRRHENTSSSISINVVDKKDTKRRENEALCCQKRMDCIQTCLGVEFHLRTKEHEKMVKKPNVDNFSDTKHEKSAVKCLEGVPVGGEDALDRQLGIDTQQPSSTIIPLAQQEAITLNNLPLKEKTIVVTPNKRSEGIQIRRRVIFPSIHNTKTRPKRVSVADANNQIAEHCHDNDIGLHERKLLVSVEDTIGTRSGKMGDCDKQVPDAIHALNAMLPELRRITVRPGEVSSHTFNTSSPNSVTSIVDQLCRNTSNASVISSLKFATVKSPAMHRREHPTLSQLPHLPNLTGSNQTTGQFKTDPRSTQMVSSSNGGLALVTRANPQTQPQTPRSIFPKSPKYCYMSISCKPETEFIPAPENTVTTTPPVAGKKLASILRTVRRYDSKIGTMTDDQTTTTSCSITPIGTPESKLCQVIEIKVQTTEAAQASIQTIIPSPDHSTNISTMTDATCTPSNSAVRAAPFSVQTRAISEPWKRTTFNPRVWVREFERSVGEWESIWYTADDMNKFKNEALDRIVRYHKIQNARLIPTGTGRMVLKSTSTQHVLTNTNTNRALFSHQALQIDTGTDSNMCDADCENLNIKRLQENMEEVRLPDLNPSSLSCEDIQRHKKHVAGNEIQSILIADPMIICLDLFVKFFRHIFPCVAISTARTYEEVIKKLTNSIDRLQATCISFDIVLIDEKLLVPSEDPSNSTESDVDTGSILLRGIGSGTFATDVGFDGVTHEDETDKKKVSSTTRIPLLIGCHSSSSNSSSSNSSCGSNSSSSSNSNSNSSNLLQESEHQKQLRIKIESRADFVWGKPPPRADDKLRDVLVDKILRKRGQVELAQKLFGS